MSSEEKEKARILARMTGIGESIAISLENLLNLEDEVKRLKDSLLS